MYWMRDLRHAVAGLLPTVLPTQRHLSRYSAVDRLCCLGHQVLLVHESFFLFWLFVDVPLSS